MAEFQVSENNPGARWRRARISYLTFEGRRRGWIAGLVLMKSHYRIPALRLHRPEPSTAPLALAMSPARPTDADGAGDDAGQRPHKRCVVVCLGVSARPPGRPHSDAARMQVHAPATQPAATSPPCTRMPCSGRRYPPPLP